MAGRLTVAGIKKLIKAGKPGLTHDGDGLYFQISRKQHYSFLSRYSFHRKPRAMGQGGWPGVSIVAARIANREAHALLDAGIDPLVARKQDRAAAANAMTVMEAAEKFIALHAPDWETKRYAEQIRNRLETYVKPVIGHLPIATIQLAEIELVLQPIWREIPATARRIRKHLEDIIDWAINKDVRTDKSNPAEKKRLKSSVTFLKLKVRNFPSLPFDRAPGFLAEVRARKGVKARALEFVMSTAVRIADICGGGRDHSVPMLWSHVDMSGRLWTVPTTKTGTRIVVPLNDATMLVLAEMQRLRNPNCSPKHDFVFPGSKRNTVLNASTVRTLVYDMGYSGIATPHGCRATFKTWALETDTGYSPDIIDSCLAHAQEELDAAYHRGTFLDKRRRLMALWGEYLEGNVVQFGNVVTPLRASR